MKFCNRLSLILLSMVSLLSFVACKDKEFHTFSTFIDFDSNGMIQNREYFFQPFDISEQDTLAYENFIAKKNYKVLLSVRYNSICSLDSLPLKYEVFSINADTVYSKNVEVPLYSDQKQAVGKGNFGLFETEVPIIHSTPYDDSLLITLSTPEINSTGIVSLGIICHQLN